MHAPTANKMWKLSNSTKVVHLIKKSLGDPTTFNRTGTAFLSKGVHTDKNQNISDIINAHVFGQPVAITHPHLINKGELVPGLRLEEFQQRRTRLLLGIQKYARDHLDTFKPSCNHVVIVPSSTKKYMSDKIPYFYRQNSDFYYLTGCLEPDSILVMSVDEKSRLKSTLFIRPKDKHAELWEGSRTGVELAIELFGVDEAYPTSSFGVEVERYVGLYNPILWFDAKKSDLRNVSDTVEKIQGSAHIQSPSALIQGMRLFKSSAEQNLMRRTCEIASTSINEVMSETRAGLSEHHIYAMVDYKCRMRNASHLAYPPVVASGTNATTIHYINNTQLCKTGELILMDAGCEYAGYTSDITRTWPVSGEFTDVQKILYDIVLQLQKRLIDMLLKEGGQTLDQLFDSMCLMLGKYMQEIGLVPKHITDDLGLTRAGYQFCPHHVSHYLGIDVHDTPLMPRSLRLLPGMVCTVEPGIYISQDRKDIPEQFRGIGIRIEDDILIVDNNKVEVLTSSCVKERLDLENLCKRKVVQKY